MAKVVAHVDSKFPGVVKEYEIWNEPDLNQDNFCETSNGGLGSDPARMADYLSLYTSAAPQMKNQAALDGVSINIGGPVIAVPVHIANWVPALIDANDSTPSNLNFISYHHYLRGMDDFKRISDVINAANDPNTGLLAVLNSLFKILSPPDEPDENVPTLPVYITETNDTAAKDVPGLHNPFDCCRNRAPFSGSWNVFEVITEFSGFYSAQTFSSTKIPYLHYFAVNVNPNNKIGFCMFAYLDPSFDNPFDCQPTPPSTVSQLTAYPQYYALQLLQLIGLQDGALLTKSPPTVSGTNCPAPCLAAMSFITGASPNTSYVMVIANPADATANYTTTWNFHNVPISTTGAPTATYFRLNPTDTGVVSNTANVTPIVGGVSVTGSGANIPPNGVVAIVYRP